MVIATALGGSSLSIAFLKSTHPTSPGIRGLRLAQFNPKLASVPAISAKLPSSTPSQAVGGNILAGAVFAALASSDSALAAQQVMELAADDNRGLAVLIPLVPAVAWVLYNILQPAVNQLNRMRSVRSLAIASLGLGTATLFVASPASAVVQEIAQIADSDNRGLVLFGILVPAIAWVVYNIFQPALNQLSRMRSAKGVIGVVGIGTASMLLTPQADAAIQEITTIAADSDARGLLLLTVLLPALGWVLFNIFQPALNQINKMRTGK
eukprot:c117_g1_i1 orf=210-1010(-)